MSTKNPISRLTIKGFKSIKNLEDLHLGSLNVLLGANGAGKSSFVSYFRMLSEMMELRLKKWTTQQGSADRVVSFGVKETQQISSYVHFGLNGYEFELEPTVEGDFVFSNERLFFDGPMYGSEWITLGSGHQETKLKKAYDTKQFQAPYKNNVVAYCYESISSWKVFHFHDTSETASVKRYGPAHIDDYLRPDASNLAAYLNRLCTESPEVYEQIRKTIQLAIPFFDDFVLKPVRLDSQEELINLQWRQKNSDYTFWPSQLSDGSIRFICLVTALLQPDPPSTIIIDEPELGLHPYAITLLGSLLRSASTRMQVIVSTQSVPLVNEFSIDDLIIVEREKGATVFKRLDEKAFETWLDDYSVGELWEKNILGGRPRR
ncbi:MULTISPECIES: AAA family ATPase [Pseudomonas]|jgi:predicted ATPase|uniref:AAA family ATPase n=1 Tax=Pseudomonas rhodesiae TaxID=76760 RepID=A0A8I1E466_9PSED|nr:MULTISPECIES: AAA family ATPase [Pseudomonas]MBB4812164.1 putative ATPase [Pseudomonas rhodesiae]MBI6599091.1 AAA family ATPase [Pseudomonas sp. S4_EA_1b]MBI6624570.1 AAA family ATPase [Pseudomonas rhodesiae]NMY81779.1 AAA family ATPase [Pseudomonas rhodesiae]PHN31006.1 recombinase RecF [Pseudomonas sp. ICMP 564]